MLLSIDDGAVDPWSQIGQEKRDRRFVPAGERHEPLFQAPALGLSEDDIDRVAGEDLTARDGSDGVARRDDQLGRARRPSRSTGERSPPIEPVFHALAGRLDLAGAGGVRCGCGVSGEGDRSQACNGDTRPGEEPAAMNGVRLVESFRHTCIGT